MRQVGYIENRQEAEAFVARLRDLSIESESQDSPSGWAIWVHNENEIERARVLLDEFLRSPPESRVSPPAPAETDRIVAEAASRVGRSRSGERWRRSGPTGPTPLTVTMVALSVFVTIAAQFDVESSAGRILAFCDVEAFTASGGAPLASIHHGEFWRVITPVFVHLDWMHLLFNMLIFQLFAARIERIQGTLSLAMLVLAAALVSNAAQALAPVNSSLPTLSGTPLFGGLSGVIYGLVGYAWVRMMFSPTAGYRLDPILLFVLMAWFVYGMVDEQQNVANVAHAAGLIVGMAAGAAHLLGWQPAANP